MMAGICSSLPACQGYSLAVPLNTPAASDGMMCILRVDAGVAMSAKSIVGRAVRILWPEDDAWFSGTIESYDSTSGQHTVGHFALLFAGCKRLSLKEAVVWQHAQAYARAGIVR